MTGYRYSPSNGQTELNLPLSANLLYELSHPPATSRHQWLFVMALKLLNYRPKHVVLELLRGAAAYISRTVPASELEDAVNNAALICKQRSEGIKAPPQHKWDPPSLAEIDAIVRVGPRKTDGIALSPVKFDLALRHTETIIDAIYPPNSLLCIARRGSWDFITAPRESYRGLLHLCQFIVPNPMIALSGFTKNGRKESAHTLDNTGPRHFLVMEFDFTAIDEAGNPTVWAPFIEDWKAAGISIADACMALIMQLARSAPLVLIVSSAGKSLHAWFRALGRDEAKLYAWMRYAVRLGACHSTWVPSQFVRLPDGVRYPGKRRQEILYFNAEDL
jgi:hypothetical protein